MDSCRKSNVVFCSLLYATLLLMYLTTLYVNELAKERYASQRSHSVTKRENNYQFDYDTHPKVHTKVVDAQLNYYYTRSVNYGLQYIFQYTHNQQGNQGLRVHVESPNATRENPVLVVVRQQRGVLSWQLPLLPEFGSSLQQYSNVSRTLCPEQNFVHEREAIVQDFFVDVSTSDHKNVSFKVIVSPVDGFQVRIDDERNITLTASEPQYFQFSFPEGVSNVLLSVTSSDNICMTVSIQNSSCPVYDLDHDLKYDGMWLTMMNKTGVTIARDRFPYGFYFVFVAKADDYECTGKRESGKSPRIKYLNFVIHEKVSYVDFMAAVIGILGVFALFYVVAFASFCIRNQNNDFSEELEPSLLETQQRHNYGAVGADNTSGNNQEQMRRTRSSESLDLSDVDLLPDAFSDKDVIRTKTFLFVADLARKGPRFHGKKSQLYMWNLLIVAIFYALPVVQLVIIYQKVLNDTGDQDLCYYNFLCAHPLGQLTDFNHVYSNLGYILLGLLFVILTARRDVMHRKAQQRHDRLERFYGIPQHYGLFYAMGTALMVEGVLSACYHICPTHANYQFDTTFMYVISMLCMLKIYQTRHPDINAEAHAAFGVLAFVVLLGVFAVFEDSLGFRIIFAALHLLCCLALSAQVYYMGRWKLNLGIFKRIYLVCWNDFQAGPANWFRPMYVDRMILLVIGLLTNIGFAIYGLIERPTDFASYVLAIFITNLLLYTTFYIIMKIRHGEKILGHSLIFIALSTISWGAALYFFINKAITWRKRAAESRMFNQECLLLNFYDFHDIWHFLSAASLFFSFLILLTLDDDLLYTPRDKIPVF